MKLLVLSLLWYYVLCGDDESYYNFNDSSYLDLDMDRSLAEDTDGYWKIGYIPLLNRRLFKATPVTIREHPYIVNVRRLKAHYVTGSLLTQNTIVTVASLIQDVPVDELSAVVGEHYSDRGAIHRDVVLVVIHDDFSIFTMQSDIALLTVYPDFIFRGSVKPIHLVKDIDSIYGNVGFVTGWGRCDRTGQELCIGRSTVFNSGEYLDPMLRSVNFVIEESMYCIIYKDHKVQIEPGTLCLGPAREVEPAGVCSAVPGAPLVVAGKLAGILTWGFGCGYEHDLPLIYTNMAHYESWIDHNLKLLNSINKSELQSLFIITQAYTFKNWLLLTRLELPPILHVTLKELDEKPMDFILALINGKVYDIRDFVYDGLCRDAKQKMFADRHEKIKHKAKMNLEEPAVVTCETHAFISNASLHFDAYGNVDDET